MMQGTTVELAGTAHILAGPSLGHFQRSGGTSMRRLARLVSAGLLVAVPLVAQVPAGLDSLLHRLYATRGFASPRFGPARWLEHGSAYTTVEPSADQKGSDIVRYETATGARSV